MYAFAVVLQKQSTVAKQLRLEQLWSTVFSAIRLAASAVFEKDTSVERAVLRADTLLACWASWSGWAVLSWLTILARWAGSASWSLVAGCARTAVWTRWSGRSWWASWSSIASWACLSR
jgi:hypothetical protein